MWTIYLPSAWLVSITIDLLTRATRLLNITRRQLNLYCRLIIYCVFANTVNVKIAAAFQPISLNSAEHALQRTVSASALFMSMKASSRAPSMLSHTCIFFPRFASNTYCECMLLTTIYNRPFFPASADSTPTHPPSNRLSMASLTIDCDLCRLKRQLDDPKTTWILYASTSVLNLQQHEQPDMQHFTIKFVPVGIDAKLGSGFCFCPKPSPCGACDTRHFKLLPVGTVNGHDMPTLIIFLRRLETDSGGFQVVMRNILTNARNMPRLKDELEKMPVKKDSDVVDSDLAIAKILQEARSYYRCMYHFQERFTAFKAFLDWPRLAP
ncbi:hypothetical protein BD410DRAFT_447340 [Rickenella mellea]|uniref:Uncharacterized protein n=1 Tax=Rickenella mellea TaxID=50990 RepID=A0A4Y7PX44_9AGAM|nr:hypothetical protein BD410DRAFT_447340 [Rickenella mellea]